MNVLKRWIAGFLICLFMVTAAFIVISYIDSGQPAIVLADDKKKETKEDENKETPDQEQAEEENQEEGEQPCPECPECPDPAKVVLQGLEDKKMAIDEAGEKLANEKKELETYEAQLDEKLASLSALKKQIEEDLARLENKKSAKELEDAAAFEAKMNRLVKVYAGMKPKAAAEIVNKMELSVTYEIFLRMREANASKILAFVESEKAAKISERLAFRKRR